MKGPVPLLVIMIPCLGLLASYAYLGANCNDDFCGALMWEAGVAVVAVSAVVAWIAAALLRRGRGLARSGAAAWSTAVALGALLFATSQIWERDTLPAIVGAIVVVAASFFAYSAARSPRVVSA